MLRCYQRCGNTGFPEGEGEPGTKAAHFCGPFGLNTEPGMKQIDGAATALQGRATRKLPDRLKLFCNVAEQRPPPFAQSLCALAFRIALETTRCHN